MYGVPALSSTVLVMVYGVPALVSTENDTPYDVPSLLSTVMSGGGGGGAAVVVTPSVATEPSPIDKPLRMGTPKYGMTVY